MLKIFSRLFVRSIVNNDDISYLGFERSDLLKEMRKWMICYNNGANILRGRL
ncbi:MAG TPA: hypothetical protein VI749_04915 [Candidatus Omnitrophota bacterium]|nr:hypothetical protein [Candidatus Omnitrophota bacterium]